MAISKWVTVGCGALLFASAWPLVAPVAEAAFADQFLWPMDGHVTSIYWECRSSCARYHRGVDIANGCDTPIYAARAGTVTVGSDPSGYGNYVKINHDHGYETLYGHMASVSVSNGQSVSTSTVLGYEGSTGSSTGCHVHFEVRQDDNGPSAELKQFAPGVINQQIARGAKVPYEASLERVKTTTSVLDGPNLNLVSGEGNVQIGTAQAGERYVAFSKWTNSAGETWKSLSFNGRVGWIRSDKLEKVGGTVARVTADGALNVRSGAGSTNADVGDVFGAQEYDRLASATDAAGATWYKIPYDGSNGAGVGWIHSSYTSSVTYGSPPQNLAGKKIAVDPGHGGTDPGASGFGLQEKTATLDIGLRLRDLLEADGATVVMTRATDATVSLADRVAIANSNNVDRFVSVHANSCGSCGGHGTETYYHSSLTSTSTSAQLASSVQSEVVAQAGTTDRGVKQADFYVLRETSMPAALVETAFIDHSGDNAILASASGRQDFALGILHGIQAHFGVPVHDPTGGGGGGPTSGMDEDFEGTVTGWTAASGGGTASWAITNARSSSPTRSYALRNYGPSENDWLKTPPIALAGLDSPTLTLKSWMKGERACVFLSFSCTIYDFGKIEVTKDGGATWRVLKDQYYTSGGVFETLSFDLSPEEGQTIQVRFTFRSDASDQFEGWYVDDVVVQ